MTKYVLRRLLSTIPVLFGVATATFFIVNILPGDPIRALFGSDENADPVRIEKLRTELGLNDPLPVRYVKYIGQVARGNLGRSVLTNRPVIDSIVEQFPSTVYLALFALLLSMVVGVTLGVVAAVRHRTWIDTAAMVGAVVGVGLPNFFLAILLILLFSVYLGWLPATSQGGFTSIILPGVSLGVASAAILARLTRSSMLEVLRSEYITTARAKGLAEQAVVVKHALRNSLIPVVTTLGVELGRLLAGAIIIETVFARPGIGRLLLGAISAKDAPVVQGTIIFSAVIFVLINLLVDLSYGFLDPRIRYS
ncbi:MAG: ABC transporter permease [Dehalococcoidia bacterium]